MNKENLADIVKKSLKTANAAIESGYEFPEMKLDTCIDERFRANVYEFYTADEQKGRMCLRGIISHVITSNEDPYGATVLDRVRSLSKDNIFYAITGTLAMPAAFAVNALFPDISGISIIAPLLFVGGGNSIFSIFSNRKLARDIAPLFIDYGESRALVAELGKVTLEELGETLRENKDDIMYLWNDMRPEEIERYQRWKAWKEKDGISCEEKDGL